MGTRGILLLIIVAALAPLDGCQRESPSNCPPYGATPARQTGPLYHLAVHPLHNPAKLFQDYQPLIAFLNSEIPNGHFILKASRDYAHFEEKILAASPEFLLPNPLQTLIAMEQGYQVVAMAGDPDDFRGVFIARQDSPLQDPSDLKGMVVTYPSPTALAACIMPQYFLQRHGIDVVRDIENRYVGSQESSIMNVYLGMSAVGATWPPPWRDFRKRFPREAAELKILWETEPFVNNSLMARNDIPAPVRERVQELLLQLHESPSGAAILAAMETSRFLPAADGDYECVRAYIVRFEREVRPVAWSR